MKIKRYKHNWYRRIDFNGLPIEVLKIGRYKALEIYKKDKRFYNGEYTFYKCLVFDKGQVVAAEGLFGSSLRYKYLAVRWGCKKLKEFGLWNMK